MTDDERDERLINSISAALGVNMTVFHDGYAETQNSPADYHDLIVLARLIKAFRSFSDEERMTVLRMTEKIATHKS